MKTKQLGPLGWKRAPKNFVCRSANAFFAAEDYNDKVALYFDDHDYISKRQDIAS